MGDLMQILVEKGIPFGKEVFSTIGRVILYDGLKSGDINASDARVLVTRSNVRVDSALLDRLPALRAILSPTIGLDHVDQAAITAYQDAHSRILPVINAPGSTASGVGDYVLASVIVMQDVLYTLPHECTIGIWGYGNCGRAAAARLRATGCEVVAYDPPLQHRSQGEFISAGLDDLLSTDGISIHLPLTSEKESSWPTRGIVDGRVLDAMRGKVVINSGRGDVVDQDAALFHAKNRLVSMVLDVYRSEPRIDPGLVKYAIISTPHIAGSIRQGKLRALEQVYKKLCNLLKIQGFFNFRLTRERIRSPYCVTSLPLTRAGREMVIKAVDLTILSRRFKDSQAKSTDPGTEFVKLRKSAMRDEITWPQNLKTDSY